jgi:hypothetical protein
MAKQKPKSKDRWTHTVVYSKDGRIIVTTPRGFARDNRSLFNNSVPRTAVINRKLDELDFKTATSAEMKIHFKFED